MSTAFKEAIKKPIREYVKVFHEGGTSLIDIRQILRELAYEAIDESVEELRGCSKARCADCNPANEGSIPSTPSREDHYEKA